MNTFFGIDINKRRFYTFMVSNKLPWEKIRVNEKFQLKEEIERLEVALKQVKNEEEKKASKETIGQMQERLKPLEILNKAETEDENPQAKAALDGDSATLKSPRISD
jgi:hypothetical protein